MTPYSIGRNLRILAVLAASLMPLVVVETAHAQGVTTVASPPNAVLPIETDSARWRFASRGKYRLVADPRGLLQVYHPWDVAGTGDYGALTARVAVPGNWHGPIYLNLYASDTYVTEGWDTAKPAGPA